MESGNYGDLTAGVHFSLVTGIEKQVKLHSDLVLLYGLRGKTEIECSGKVTGLGPEDIMAVNLDEPYVLQCPKGAAATAVRLSARVLGQVIRRGGIYFRCCSPSDSSRNFRQLRHLFRQLVLSYAGNSHSTEAFRYGLAFSMLDELVENFRSEEFSGGEGSLSGQVIQVMTYVNLHYGESIRLSDLAEQYFTSASTLSRAFRKQTGIYFEDYVRKVRLQYACSMLSDTDEPMIRIAMDCGFSTSATFNRTFKEAFQMAPTEYRSRLRETRKAEQEKEDTLASMLTKEEAKALEQRLRQESDQTVSRLQVRVEEDADGMPFHGCLNRMIIAGRAEDLLTANMQYHIQYLFHNLHAEYVSVWNLFSLKMAGPWQKGKKFSWGSIDAVLDYLVQNGMKPFLDLSTRPDTAVSAENQTVYYEIPLRKVPGREVWFSELRDFLRHVRKRYGEEEASSWKYVFTETYGGYIRYYEGDEGDYRWILREGVRAVHEILPSAQAGGVGGDIESFTRVVPYLAQAGIRPDFFTMMCFPVKTSREGKVEKVPASRPDPRYAMQDAKRILNQNGYGNAGLYITDYNLGLSNRSFLNDSCGRAAYLLETAGMLKDLPEAAGLWMASDWSSAYYDVTRISYGGSGMITRDGVRKPAYYALSFLDCAGESCLYRDGRCIVTRKKDGEWIILLNNRRPFSADYYLENEDRILPQNADSFFEDMEELTVHLSLPVRDGGYILKTSTVSPSHGSILAVWGRFQYEELEGDEAGYLRSQCVPELSRRRIAASGGRLSFEEKLEPNAIRMIRIREEERD